MVQGSKILFILKQKAGYAGCAYGLLNSCQFLASALASHNIQSKIVQVVDNNDIDREVTDYQPTHVIIEALWVVPDKFDVLLPLHPTVRWAVRIHSQIPFLGTEGIAFQWLSGYRDISAKYPQFSTATNNLKLKKKLAKVGYQLDYLPNVYLTGTIPPVTFVNKATIDIGCFGAIRPFKNHLEQAVGAIAFANSIKKTLNFHINTSAFETDGVSILQNIRSLFATSAYSHKLIEHGWVNHDEFIQLVRTMDLGLQVSFTETFNIVAADFVSNHIPLVGSPEIDWLSSLYKASPTDAQSIANKLTFAWDLRPFNGQYLNERGLAKHNRAALNAWLNFN